MYSFKFINTIIDKSTYISIFEKKYTPLFSKLAPLYAELMDITKADSKKTTSDAVATGNSAVTGAFILSAAAVLFSIIVSLVLSRSISGSSARIPANFRRWQAVLPLATTT